MYHPFESIRSTYLFSLKQRNMKRIFTLFGFLCLILIQCKTSESTVEFYPPNDFYLLDSVTAALAISEDNMEDFFEKVRTLDMEIQMGKTLSGTREESTQTYKNFLQKDVANFTEKEAEYVRKTVSKARQLCNKISPDIFPKPLNLIKTKANHYGKSIYYTRENSIIIPYDVLSDNRNEDAFLEVMLHEIFHIYSRLHPDKRKQLYELIGFRKTENIQLPPELDRRMLLNPDGIDIEQLIDVSFAGINSKLIPLLYSKTSHSVSDSVGFFTYLEFELFEVKKEGEVWMVQVKDDYKSTTPEYFQADFQRQIGQNTGYIWHPDEILADNFAFLALIRGDLLKMKNFESEGRELLRRIETVLKQ